MLAAEDSLVPLIGAFYESAAFPERWQDFLRSVAQCMDCDKAAITLHDDRLLSWDLHQSFGLPPESMTEYNDHYGAINPAIPPLFKIVRKTGSWYGQTRSLCGEREYKQSEYYNEFGSKYGSYWGVMGAVGYPSNSVIALSVVRAESKRAPEPASVELMGRLMPHFACVIKIHHAMESLRSMTNAAMTAVDTLEVALLAVDSKGEVVLTNAEAERLLRRQDGVILSRKHLSAKNPHESRDLEFLVQSAAATGAGKNVHPGGSLLIAREASRPLQVSVVPFRSSYMLNEASPRALIFISDPDAQSASRASVLSALYRLTPSECRLADLLLQDLDLTAAADSMGITSGTARFVLKSIFRKTGTHRQPELIRLLLGLPNITASENEKLTL